LNPELYKEMAK